MSPELQITTLLYRYAELIDAGDFDGVGALLGRATFGGPASGLVSGEVALSRLFASTTRRYPEHGNTPRTRHLVLNPIVEVDDDCATCRSTFVVVQRTETLPLQPIVVGRYTDKFGRDAGGWYFTSRIADAEMVGDVSEHLTVDPTTYGR